MIGKDNTDSKPEKSSNRRNILIWVSALIIILGAIGGYMVWFTYGNAQTDFWNLEQQMNPNVTESGMEASDYEIPTNTEKVTTGIYIDRIKSLSVKDNIWSVDFYIWFNWTGEDNPGEYFQVVDGSIDKKELVRNITEGNQSYSLYQISATVTKNFDILRFPVDEQFLTIDIQDKQLGREDILYVPDTQNSGIAPSVKVPGYDIDGMTIVEKPYEFNTTLGDPSNSTTFSQLRTGIMLSRPDLSFFFKSLIGIFIAVFAALAALLIRADYPPPRFGIIGGALFVGIGNMILVSSLVPNGVYTVADMITSLGMGIIALALLESAISLRYHHNKQAKLARKLDRYSLAILAIGFVVIVITLIITAM